MSIVTKVSRRDFLKAGAGLTLAVSIPSVFANNKLKAGGPGLAGSAVEAGNFAPNAFVTIGSDNTVTVISKHLEMGQGVYTGLATLVAEELDADWSTVKVEGAGASTKHYNKY